MKSSTLRASLSWSLAGNVYYAATQWLMLVIIAKWGSTSMVGQFSLCLAVVTPIMTLTNLQLRVVQATDTQNQYAFRDMMGLRLLSIVVAAILAEGAVLIFHYDRDTTVLLWLVWLAKAVEGASDVSQGVFQKYDRMKLVAMSKIVKGTLVVPAFIFALVLYKNLIFAAVGWGLMWFISFLAFDLPMTKKYETLRLRIQLKSSYRLMKICLPLGIVFMLTSLNTNIPRLFIEKSSGVEQLGIFSALTYLLVAGSTIVSALGQAATNRLAVCLDRHDYNRFYRLIFKLMAMGFALGLAGIAASVFGGEHILSILYTDEYAHYSDVFIIVTIAGLIDYIAVFTGYGLSATKRFGVQPYLGLLWTIAIIAACGFMIPLFGILGAAYSLAISSLVRLAAQWLALRAITRKMQVNYDKKLVNVHEAIV
ncbi:lipopolysaccharide biosynthesis protein [Cohnella sp. 56]|uniref:lipopolysaccharide biosynthesis protein n=1 Tax=Cohnella sp. 56 TaxID=3113722 RepID=UPI0030E9D325